MLEALNRLLDDNRELLIPETQEVVTPHPAFQLWFEDSLRAVDPVTYPPL